MAKTIDYNTEEEMILLDYNEDYNSENKIIFEKFPSIEKVNHIPTISYEEYGEMMSRINDTQGNNLITFLGLSDVKVIIHEGYPENIKFCHFRDVDNGIDYSLRQVRNQSAKNVIYNFISKSQTLKEKFIEFCNSI
jgi:hypothetical protein